MVPFLSHKRKGYAVEAVSETVLVIFDIKPALVACRREIYIDDP